jgi:hypothetical protein
MLCPRFVYVFDLTRGAELYKEASIIPFKIGSRRLVPAVGKRMGKKRSEKNHGSKKYNNYQNKTRNFCTQLEAIFQKSKL